MPLYCNDGEPTNIDYARSAVLGGSRARTICPDTTVFSRDELQMRKKAEVLQQKKNAIKNAAGISLSKNERYYERNTKRNR